MSEDYQPRDEVVRLHTTRQRDDSAAFEHALMARYSCRSFKETPIDEATLRRLLQMAGRSPSSCNVQPWNVYVTSGESTLRLRDALQRGMEEGNEISDLRPADVYSGQYAERRRAAGYGLYEALGIARTDRAARAAQMDLNLSFFGAPHVIVVTCDIALGEYAYVDCGVYIGNLLNAATSLGLGSIAQGAIAYASTTLHDFFAIDNQHRVVGVVAIGRADNAHPANRFRTDRAQVDELVHWV